jgi:hypothetical protein
VGSARKRERRRKKKKSIERDAAAACRLFAAASPADRRLARPSLSTKNTITSNELQEKKLAWRQEPV